MNRKTQMSGLRLGFTYAAGLVVLAFLVAMLTTPPKASAARSPAVPAAH